MLPYAIAAAVLSIAYGVFSVARMGEASCILAGLLMTISLGWVAGITLNAREISSDLYAKVAEVRDPDYRMLIRTRMSDGKLTYAELASAKAALESIEQDRGARRLASRLG
jgi:hypothetical protein